MKRKLFWRSVLRRPLAAVLILLLLGAAALGVGEKFTEYSAVSSQVDALNDYYRPIGQLVSTDGDVGAGAELISSSAYVDFSDTRRYVAGVLDGLYNADIDGNSSDREGIGVNVSEILAYAELLSKERSAEGGYEYMFRVTEAVYGYPERVGEKMRLLMYHADDGDEAFALEDAALEVGGVYLVRAYYHKNSYITGIDIDYTLRRAEPGGNGPPGLCGGGGSGQFAPHTGQQKADGDQSVETDAVPGLQSQHIGFQFFAGVIQTAFYGACGTVLDLGDLFHCKPGEIE